MPTNTPEARRFRTPRLPRIVPLLGAAVRAWWDDNAISLGASVAYYTLFAIAPVLLVAIAIAGLAFGPEAVRGEIVGQVDNLIGVEGGRAVQALLQGASRPADGWLAAGVGAVTFLLAASGAFLELQSALNTVWRVEIRPAGHVRTFVVDRLRSFAIVVAIGFLLLVSLTVSAGLAALEAWMSRAATGLPSLLSGLNIGISLVVTTGLFAMLFKFLPDVDLLWGDVAVGASVTALLFTAGKYAIGLYLGQSTTTSSYGAAGSVVVLLLWVYYSAQLVLIGAEFTRLYANRTRGHVPVSEFAAPAS